MADSASPLILSQVDEKFNYSYEYRVSVFLIWIKNGKPGRRELHKLIPDDENGAKPHEQTLHKWIHDPEWLEAASKIDYAVAQKLEDGLITEKVKMMQELADVGKEEWKMGLEYLRTHQDEITVTAAVRMIADGTKLEKESRGLSGLMEEISAMSDDKLLEKLRKSVEGKELDIDELEEALANS